MLPSDKELLKEYFRSVEHLFDETLTRQGRPNWPGIFVVANLTLLLFSIISFLPSSLAQSVPALAKVNELRVLGYSIPLTSLWLWYPACLVVFSTGLWLSIKWDSARDEKNKRELLSEPQIRFACCYSIVDEISKYRTNGLQKHMDAAFGNWRRLRSRLPQILRPFGGLYPPSHEARRFGSRNDEAWTKGQIFIFYPEIEVLKGYFSWFRLEAQTEAIIGAFYALPAKIQDRIHDKKDLDVVVSCLTELSGYLYSRIPDVPSQEGNVSLAEFASRSLQSLVEQLIELPVYSTETKATSQPKEFWKTLVLMSSKITVPFAHSNIFLCFLAWYILTLVLTLGALKITLHFLPGMRVDSVLVSVIVGGPLACGVSAVALSRSRKRSESSAE